MKNIAVPPEAEIAELRASEAFLRNRTLLQAAAVVNLKAAMNQRAEEIERLRTLLIANDIDPDPPGDETPPEGVPA